MIFSSLIVPFTVSIRIITHLQRDFTLPGSSCAADDIEKEIFFFKKKTSLHTKYFPIYYPYSLFPFQLLLSAFLLLAVLRASRKCEHSREVMKVTELWLGWARAVTRVVATGCSCPPANTSPGTLVASFLLGFLIPSVAGNNPPGLALLGLGCERKIAIISANSEAFPEFFQLNSEVFLGGVIHNIPKQSITFQNNP